jgi:hypothetical protein
MGWKIWDAIMRQNARSSIFQGQGPTQEACSGNRVFDSIATEPGQLLTKLLSQESTEQALANRPDPVYIEHIPEPASWAAG